MRLSFDTNAGKTNSLTGAISTTDFNNVSRQPSKMTGGESLEKEDVEVIEPQPSPKFGSKERD